MIDSSVLLSFPACIIPLPGGYLQYWTDRVGQTHCVTVEAEHFRFPPVSTLAVFYIFISLNIFNIHQVRIMLIRKQVAD